MRKMGRGAGQAESGGGAASGQCSGRFGRCAVQKLRSAGGETLAEVLAALMIGVPAMGMIAGAIVTSANINRSLETESGQLQKFLPSMDKQHGTAESVSLSGMPAEAGASGTFTVQLYNDDEKEYFFYFTETE